MLVQQLARPTLFDPRRDRHELLRHELRDLLIEVLLEAHVAARENADGPIALDDRETRDLVTAHELERVVERLPGTDGHRVDDHPGFRALDLGDLEGLMRRAHVLVEDPDAALARHGDRRPPLGDGVHRARNERNSKLELPREARGDIGVGGQKIGVPRQEQHVIEGERFP